MAIEVVDRERFVKAFDKLEAEKALITDCTQVWKNLSLHFSSLEESLLQKSKALDSKFEALDSETKKTLEAIEARENSIPERESAAVARVEEQREAALSEFEKTVDGSLDLSESLKSYCRKMDSAGLLKFIVVKRKESVALRTQIPLAIAESVDPLRLVLDAIECFISQRSPKAGVPDRRWACGLLLQALFPAIESGGQVEPVAGSIAERALAVAEAWKAKLEEKEEGVLGPVEATLFLQMIIGFGLKSKFDEEFLRKLVLDFASRSNMPKLATALGFGEKMGDIIDELVKNGKDIEAVYFAIESGLTERFDPPTLLRTYLRNTRKNVANILKTGRYSMAATDEASTVELNSTKAIIKCVEDHKLESKFTLESLRNRVVQLEKEKGGRRKSVATTGKPQNKRARGGGGGGGGGPQGFRSAKSGRFSNTYPTYGRREPAPVHHNPAARFSAQYKYPTVYEGAASTTFASPYGAPHTQHTQNPAAIPQQQHYAYPPEDLTGGAARTGVPYGGQTSYGTYDYGNVAPATYQLPYPQQ